MRDLLYVDASARVRWRDWAKTRLGGAFDGMPLPLLLAWVCYTAYVFLHAGARVHDEIDFLILAKGVPLWSMVGEAPPALYGSLFWVGLKLAGSAHAARLFMLVLFVLTPWLVMLTTNSARMKLGVLVLWLSMPVSWWSGKLIGPEIPIMFMIALAAFFLHRNKPIVAAVALGVSVGLKISAAPAVVFFVLAYLLRGDETPLRRVRSLPLLGAAFVLALFIACPPFLTIFSELSKQPGHLVPGQFWTQAAAALMAYRWEWDAVFSGGVLHFTLMPIPLVLLSIGMLLRNWRLFAAAIASAFVFLLMSINSASAYGWYWIAFFPIVIYAVSRDTTHRYLGNDPWAVALCAIGALNFVLQLPVIVDQMYQRAEQIRVLDQKEGIQSCIGQKLAELKPNAVYNLSEFGLDILAQVPVYTNPSPEALAASVQLIGTRMLVGRRFPDPAWTGGRYLHATCDAVLIFSTHSPGDRQAPR